MNFPFPPRLARLVLTTPDGRWQGALPPLEVASPWWQDIAPVLKATRERFGLDVTVLRLLYAERAAPPGGTVTYLAEVLQPCNAEAWSGPFEDHALRHPWARPGGPAADLAWAHAKLKELGIVSTGQAEQQRTWNLSSLWRLPCETQSVWLKCVPAFFVHEGPLLERLQGAPVPTLLAQENGRLLLAEIPGEDLHAAPLPTLISMVTLLVTLQCAWLNRSGELLKLGVPDWRSDRLRTSIETLVRRIGPELPTEDRETLQHFVAGLEARFVRLAACGLPDTLIHGDFHPGNLRGSADVLTLLDWADSGVGHPLLDVPAFLEWLPADALEPVRKHFHAQWRQAIPGSDPERAAQLLRPAAMARKAVVYQGFLDAIEPSEHPYHAADPVDWLRRTAAVVRDSENSDVQARAGAKR